MMEEAQETFTTFLTAKPYKHRDEHRQLQSPDSAAWPSLDYCHAGGFGAEESAVTRDAVAGQSGGELVWRGRAHVGDEPGIYGDASYSGLSLQFPVELRAFPDASGGEVIVVVEAEEVRIHAPSQGHPVVVLGHGPDPTDPSRWHVWEIGRHLLTTGTVSAATIVIPAPVPSYVSIHVEVDKSIAAGLYDDFVVVRLTVRSSTHYAALGFRTRP